MAANGPLDADIRQPVGLLPGCVEHRWRKLQMRYGQAPPGQRDRKGAVAGADVPECLHPTEVALNLAPKPII
jgi:hypothetical protein